MRWRRDGLAALAIAAVAWLLTLSPPLDRLRAISIDLLLLLRAHTLEAAETAPGDSQVAVIAIDEETYRSPPFADTPNVMWTREIARVLTALVNADVKAVGFDIVYPTSVERFIPGYEREFLVALRRAAQRDKVVLGKVQHQHEPLIPFAGQRLAVRDSHNIRSLNLFADADDVVRRTPLLFDAGDGKTEPSLSLELVQRALGTAAERSRGELRLGEWTIPGSTGNTAALNFRRGIGIASYTLHDLVACLGTDPAAEFFRAQFAGKVVLIGAVLDVEDRKVSSMRWITEPERPANGPRCASTPRHDLFDSRVVRDTIPGVFIHATAVANLLERRVLLEAPRGVAHAVTFFLALSAAALALLFKPARATLLLIAVMVAWTAAATAFAAQAFILPVVVPGVAAAFAFATTLGWRFAVSDRDKRFLRESFAMYLSPTVIERLVEDNNPPELGGEERSVTLFFSDLAGFSSMSEGLLPDETVRVMNAYLGAMTEEIEAAGGMVDKYIGDAIVALFGAPVSAADHAQQAVSAALACRERLARLNADLPGLKAPLKQRIGLHSGPALVGNIGSARRFNYTAMGDTVNLASRLEGANKQFDTDILASEATARAATATAWRELDAVRVVGRKAAVRVFTPVRPGENSLAADYADALAAYRARDFARAAAVAHRHAAQDKASARLRERAQALAAAPPEADWQPVTDLSEK